MPPPDCFAKPRTWLNPSPDPLPISLVVKNGSKAFARTSLVIHHLCLRRCYRYRSHICHRVARIDREIENDEFYLSWVCEGGPDSRPELRVDGDAAANRALQQVMHVLQRFVHVERFRL